MTWEILRNKQDYLTDFKISEETFEKFKNYFESCNIEDLKYILDNREYNIDYSKGIIVTVFLCCENKTIEKIEKIRQVSLKKLNVIKDTDPEFYFVMEKKFLELE